ncbi:sugar-phosphatase [Plesiomonas shigelloides]|uniref:sugar-phosphatase n=1 Tax=Plesiomonas shigelloides TaxID=703 RepID=UPI003EBD94FE
MYKLLALDIDGTLLTSQGEISPNTREAIAKARAMGVKVVLASGRPLEGMLPYLNTLGLNTDADFVLCYNGSLIQKAGSHDVVRSCILSGHDAHALQTLSRELGVNIHAFSRRLGLITPKRNQYTEHEAKLNGIPLLEMDFAELPADEEILKVMFIDEPEVLSAAIARLTPDLHQRYTIVQSAPYFLEFLNPSSNKGIAVGMLADYLGLDPSEVICVGDAGNDRHMIEFAGLGVAMGNATEDIKAIADFVTKSNDQDGIAHLIERFIVNPELESCV